MINFIRLNLIRINSLIWEIEDLLLLDSLNFVVEAVNQLHECNIQFLTAFDYCIRRSDLSISLDLHFYFFFERMRFFVTSKFYVLILKKLISNAVAKSMILVMDCNCPCESLSLIIFVCHSIYLRYLNSFLFTYFVTTDESPPLIYYWIIIFEFLF